MNSANRVLILSPHTDDGEIAAGGTIARLVAEGKSIYYVAFSSCEVSVPQGFPPDALKSECEESIKTLGISHQRLTLLDFEVRTFPSHRQEILENMVKLNEAIKPDLILIPSSNDLHQDHQVIHSEALRAFKMSSSMWGYEHPRNNLEFTTDIFVKLEEEHITKKINALRKYKSQEFRAYFSETYIRALAYTRGTQVNIEYAEAFELLRLIVR